MNRSAAWREVVVLAEKEERSRNTLTRSAVMRGLGEACIAAGQYEEAVNAGEELLATSRKLFSPEEQELFLAIDSLG